MTKEILNKIIQTAVMAPSGENSQPWRFEAFTEQIKIYNLPDRDTSIYNRLQWGSLVAHGALLENIKIAAGNFCYKTKVEIPESLNQSELVATVTFEQSEKKEYLNELFAHISERTTNRKPYKKEHLKEEVVKSLQKISENFAPLGLKIEQNETSIAKLAGASSLNEQLLFENETMHDFFFSHITWSKEEDQKKSLGFFVKTLELPPPAELIFKLAKKFSRLKFLNKFGVSKLVRKANLENYKSCGGVLIISTPDFGHKNIILTGSLLQALWLTLTSLGFAAQPMSAILFLYYSNLNKMAPELKSWEAEQVNSSYQEIKNFVKSGNPIFMLRTGIADKPSAKATRLEPNIVWNI